MGGLIPESLVFHTLGEVVEAAQDFLSNKAFRPSSTTGRYVQSSKNPGHYQVKGDVIKGDIIGVKPEDLTEDGLSSLRKVRRGLLWHSEGIDRLLTQTEARRKKVASGETGLLDKQIAELTKLKSDFKQHPLLLHTDESWAKFISGVKGYGGFRAFSDRAGEIKTAFGIWMRNNKWAGFPMVGALILLKLTVGIWLLKKIDDLLGTKSVQGNPLPVNNTAFSNESPIPGHKRMLQQQTGYMPSPYGAAPGPVALPPQSYAYAPAGSGLFG